MRSTDDGPVRAILFDMDGVLVFSEDAWFAVYNETLLAFGHPAIARAAFDAIYGNGTEADRDTYMQPSGPMTPEPRSLAIFVRVGGAVVRSKISRPRVVTPMWPG